MRPRANRTVLTIGIIFQIVGVFAAIAGVMASQTKRHLLDHGQMTTGRVVAKQSRLAADGETIYRVQIAYFVRVEEAESPLSVPGIEEPPPSLPEGRRFETTIQPDRALFNTLREGGAMDIVYDPERPSRATLKQWLVGGSWWGPMLIYVAAGGFFALVGFFLTLRQLRYR